MLGVSPYIMHHDPKVYPDPEQFKSERWLDQDPPKPMDYLPFGVYYCSDSVLWSRFPILYMSIFVMLYMSVFVKPLSCE